jgi:2-polyprenyl-3-methyl-5-hydroxy-6-metoxy-1,4-benzoquinol methylase
MNIITRKNCAITEDKNLTEVFTFKNFPIFMGCVDFDNDNPDQYYDMKWGVSDKGIIQLMELLPLDLLYYNHHTPGTVGKTWELHHKKFANFIKKSNPKNILEIGGATGKLVDHFISTNEDFSWNIIEPSEQKSKDLRVKFFRGFFEEFEFNQKFDAVIHSHLCEHVYEPHTFFNKINSILEIGGIQYISIPNMKHWLSMGYLNTLNFEHTFYIDEYVLEYILWQYDFEIEEKEIDNHSIFIKAVKKEKNNSSYEFDFSYIKPMFDNYIKKLSDDVECINSTISGEQFYLFGAHIFSQYLISMGINENQIINILDNDFYKQEKRMYGTNITVKSPKCLSGIDSPKIVLRSGSYDEEIKNGILEINSTAIFI